MMSLWACAKRLLAKWQRAGAPLCRAENGDFSGSSTGVSVSTNRRSLFVRFGLRIPLVCEVVRESAASRPPSCFGVVGRDRTVEYMPWTHGLFEEIPIIEEGQLAVPQKPGLGLTFDQDALKRYQVGVSLQDIVEKSEALT